MWRFMNKNPSAKKTCIDSVETSTGGKLPEVQLEHQVAILEATPDFVGYADAKTQHILYINQAGRKMTGLTKDEDVTKLKIFDVHPEWTNQLFDKEILPTAIREGVWNGECAFRNRDGREIPVMMVLISHKAIDGEVERFSTISRDITDRKQAEAMRESEERYRALVENANDIVFRLDDTGHMTFVNSAALRIMGYEEKEIIGRHYPTFLRPDMREEAMRFFGRQFVKGIPNTYSEYPVIMKGGREIWLGQNTQLIFQDGKVVAFQAVARDITERKRMEEVLRESEGRFRALVEQAAVGVAEIEMSTGRFFTVNRRLCELLGRTEEEMLATTFQAITHPEDLRLHEEKTALLFAGKIGNYSLEKRYFRKDGAIVWVNLGVSPLWKPGEKPGRNMIVVEDITERKRVEEALRESEKRYRELSIVDDLTQLYNSRHFYFQLKIELDRSNRYEQPLTLLLLDLDNFKAFNDAYGHVEGDQVLRRLGQVVKRCLRETDFAYRYGGEEFTILLPMTTSVEGVVTAERIRTELKKETFSPAPGQDVHMTASIGLAQYNLKEEMKAFVHRVDQLMYQGKKNGKDRVCSES
jgi:diguanylate cyclase (GGDEF)-like protein/PAS domain S-box-containing protein